ncbi:PREDICTED: uncharacterized protein LOC105450598 [Wasmannia auropunctata]|uniref:uncharacterized protein LOC105450598 n=1 Tax=Wasmannia auropunctata TaxID=64793 RepID=UPI0005EE11AF|nr:PREDICTED: uncharacterized protein LOC105450598 [Wasmannia auropunctata]
MKIQSGWTYFQPSYWGYNWGTSLKEDIGAAAAELTYGTTLRIPGEFFLDEEMPSNPQTIIEKFREHMRRIRSSPAAHHSKSKIFAHKTLFSCTHAFVRSDATKKPLKAPYEGPFEILDRPSDRIFTLKIKGEAQNISTERLKPVFFEKQETQEATSPSSSQDLRTYPSAKKKTQHVTFKDT